jgi:hypothetical protein
MTIQNTDLLLVNRGNASYKETYNNLIPDLDAVTTKGGNTDQAITVNTDKITLSTDGSASFAGTIKSTTWDANGYQLENNGSLGLNAAAGTTGNMVAFNVGGTPVANITALGTASFSGTVDAAGFTVDGSPISSGASVTVQSTAPTGASEGDLWWNDVDGRLFVYYTDSDGSQWVDASPEGYAYNDQDVNALLNTSSAATGNILSWTGTDYLWIGQSSPTPGTGTIVQVQHTLKRDTWGTTSTTYEKIPGMSVSITPTKADSKILISTSMFVGSSESCSSGLGLYRDNTLLNQYAADAAGNSGNQMITGGPFANAQYGYGPQCMQVLDSPNTTSTIVYSVGMFRNGAGSTTQYINRRNFDAEQLGSSTITVMEIA